MEKYFFYFVLLQTPATNQPQVTDDLIFSGAGSGCNVDDEDHCKVPIDNSNTGGSLDLLVSSCFLERISSAFQVVHFYF